MTNPSVFKTPEDETAYRAAYDATLKELWPVPYKEIEVPSRFGITHLVTSGPEDAPPLLLLHGFMNTLNIWAPNVAAFSKAYRIYAIDIMGHPSKSIPDEPIRSTAELVEWFGATLDGLNLDRVSIAGISFGAWIALSFAMTAPERVHKLVLLSPAASFQPLVTQFTVRAILSGIIPTRGMMNSFMKWMGLEDTPGDPVTGHLLDLMWAGGKHFQMPPETRQVMPTVFTDKELRALQPPVLLLMGENEVIYDPAKALTRARQLVPNLQGELLPNCKHEMCISQHQIVNARTLQFLNGS